jgi:hypothetical protein
MAQTKGRRGRELIYFAKGCRGKSLPDRVTGGFAKCQVDIINPEDV